MSLDFRRAFKNHNFLSVFPWTNSRIEETRTRVKKTNRKRELKKVRRWNSKVQKVKNEKPALIKYHPNETTSNETIRSEVIPSSSLFTQFYLLSTSRLTKIKGKYSTPFLWYSRFPEKGTQKRRTSLDACNSMLCGPWSHQHLKRSSPGLSIHRDTHTGKACWLKLNTPKSISPSPPFALSFKTEPPALAFFDECVNTQTSFVNEPLVHQK